jgi:HSP20 family protein
MTQMGRQTPGRSWTPRADVFETEDSLIIQLDIPGVDTDQVDVQCEKGRLSVTGERPSSVNVPKRQYYRIENSYGAFERYFDLPRTVDISGIEAKYHDGVLTLTLPKTEDAKPKKIAIITDE